jgi:glycosyltransferase involved in cell wall biosynthesis
MKIVHVITGLNGGGAQYFLYRLLPHLLKNHQCEVISLSDIGLLGEKIGNLGVPVRAVEMGRSPFVLGSFFKLRRYLKTSRPDVVHTWMYHSDLLGGLAARSLGIRGVVWAIHSPDVDERYIKLPTRIIARICAALSSFIPASIVSCSQAAWENHARFGFRPRNITVIPNGFDVSSFRPNAEARRRIRIETGIAQDAPVVGMIARFHEQKGHKDFLSAATRLREQVPSVRLLLAGRDIDRENQKLMQWIKGAGLESTVVLVGPRNDVPDILASLDALVSPSLGEAFPLIIGEAMACGVPCVATNVGDTALIMGDTGIATEPGDMQGIVDGLIEILTSSSEIRAARSYRARQRILDNFEMEHIAQRYMDVYEREAVPDSGLRRESEVC